jgi:hypothetical protein
VWNQSFLFNVDGKELDRVHIHVFTKGLLSDTPIGTAPSAAVHSALRSVLFSFAYKHVLTVGKGRCDIPIENLLKAKTTTYFQLVSTSDFNKIAGSMSSPSATALLCCAARNSQIAL